MVNRGREGRGKRDHVTTHLLRPKSGGVVEREWGGGATLTDRAYRGLQGEGGWGERRGGEGRGVWPMLPVDSVGPGPPRHPRPHMRSVRSEPACRQQRPR